MGDEDHIEVGCDVPREVGGLGDGIVLVGWLGHGIILGGAGLWCGTRHDRNTDQERQPGWSLLAVIRPSAIHQALQRSGYEVGGCGRHSGPSRS